MQLDEIIRTMKIFSTLPEEYRERVVEQSLTLDAVAVVEREIFRTSDRKEGMKPSIFFYRKLLKGSKEENPEIPAHNSKFLSMVHVDEVIEGNYHCATCKDFLASVLKLKSGESPPEHAIKKIFGTYIEQLDKANSHYTNRINGMTSFEIYYELSTQRDALREKNEDGRYLWALVRSSPSGRFFLSSVLVKDEIPDCYFCAAGTVKPDDEKPHNAARKEWEYVKCLIEKEKELSQQLEATRNLYQGASKESAQHQQHVQKLEADIEALKREKEALAREFSAKTQTPDSEWARQLENDVTKYQARNQTLEARSAKLAEGNLTLERKLETALLENERLKGRLMQYEKKQPAPVQANSDEKRALIEKYAGKKVVVFGGHKDQVRNIKDILEPVGAKIVHVQGEHDGDWKDPPKVADLVIMYTDYATHKMEWTLNARAPQLRDKTVRFSGSKANLYDFLAEQAKRLSAES